MTSDDEPHTVDYLVIEFPGHAMVGAGLSLLVDLVDGGVGRVLDLVFIRKDLEGSTSVIDVSELSEVAQVDLAVLVGVCTGRLSHLGIAAAGAQVDAGSTAGIVVFQTSADMSGPPLEAQPSATSAGAMTTR